MRFTETDLKGAYILDIEPRGDERGFFARTFCLDELRVHKLLPFVAQINVAYNKEKGTLRGLHFQKPPFAETKLVRCIRGAILDVIVDLRPESPTYLRHAKVELTAENRRALYVPQLFAHGYQTLTDDAELEYVVSQFYAPECESGVRFDDPALAIDWPLPVGTVSDKDRAWPLVSR